MYSIKEAATRSGVSIPTLRAWERRYGVVQPVRTPSGYRLYDDGAIARLRHMRTLVASGWRPREAAQRVVEAPVGQLAERPAPGRAPTAGQTEGLIEAFLSAALRYDPGATEAVLDETFATGGFEWAMELVVFPALERVGFAWQAGELSVAAEHAASLAVFRRLALFYEASARSTAAEVIIGLPPGARHDLGALAFAVAARRLGVDLLFIGADVPVESWVRALRDSTARVAVVAVPTAADASPAAEVLRELDDRLPEVTRLAGGGGSHELPSDAEAIVLPNSISEAAHTLATLLAEGPRAAARRR